MNKKKFDCVELMRSIRDRHWIEYEKDPALREKRLKEIREKYGFSKQEKIPAR